MSIETVTVTGGAGYVGSRLIPKLLAKGYKVRVLDLMIYGREVLDEHPNLTLIQGDIRDVGVVRKAVGDADAVIHLACISNDPSFELNPDLGRSINFEAFEPLVDLSIESGVQRFIYASSSSVYGIKEEPNVTEDLALSPLTDYSKYKALCEEILEKKRRPGFTTLTIRPATVCGYAPRLRLDVCVNLLTSQAYTNKEIRIFGGAQLRPNIHIEDMTDLYVHCLDYPSEQIDGKVFNAGYQNLSIAEIGNLIRERMSEETKAVVTPTDDNRSYHISSQRIEEELGFEPKHTIADAIEGLVEAFDEGRVPNMMNDKRYYNIKTMQEIGMR